ncbi:MAG: transcription elongation factor GreA [Candidatus Omnitrophica bacterium]|nr:transcription elongation factor GreA [Candidatus Omnitrophota bacterium]
MPEVYLTRAGYHKLFEELESLKQERKNISKAIGEARLLGDISENAEYDAAKDAQAHNEARISDLETKLAMVRIIEEMDIPSDKVYIGAIVDLQDLSTKEKLKYILVSPEEADYEKNMISILSPIGRALIGKAAGEEVLANVPAGVLKYKVLKIERPK